MTAVGESSFFLDVAIGGLILAGVGTNLTSLLFIGRKLMLNQHVLLLLKVHSFVMLSLTAMSLIGYSFVTIANVRNILSCSLFRLPCLAGLVSCYVFPAAIAVIR